MSVRHWLNARGVRWHAQNLTPDNHGPMWQAGRAWLRVSVGDGNTGEGYREILEINPEWHVGLENAAGLGIQLGGGDSDSDIMLHAELALARVYLTFESRSWRSLMDRILPGYWIDRAQNGPYQHHAHAAPGRLKINQETEVEVRWREGAFWWSLWHPTMEWSSKTPKWRHGSFNVLDWLLGPYQHSKREISTESVLVPMPEKSYAATVTLYEATWRRARWPFSLRRRTAEIDVPGGIPHPGKGENSWDCGDDATYSLSCHARQPEQAIAKMVESVLRSRRRYGGAGWVPREPVVA